MAIHPSYAEAILAGRKTVEFRKRRLAFDISSVLIYATSPVQRVIGEFIIDRIVADSPEGVWRQFGDVGCIEWDAFDVYYASSEVAVAIQIKSTRQFPEPVPLSAFTPQPPIPQSFAYLDELALAGSGAGSESAQPVLKRETRKGPGVQIPPLPPGHEPAACRDQ